MAGHYTVVQGDCLYSIAREHGFSSWRKIYDHPENAGFRRRRPDPDLIFPGDRLYIPDRDAGEETGATEKRHRFEAKGDRVYLNLVIEDEEGDPLEGSYRLDVEGRVQREGELESGRISVRVPPDVRTGTLIVQAAGAPPSEAWQWQLEIGGLDPVDEVAGVQERLSNLGHECGPADDVEGPRTRAGVESFQRKVFASSQEWDGVAGPRTKEKLREHHRI